MKRVYDPHSSADGKRILVDRLWPRGLKKEKARVDEWLKEIAPSDQLRKWYAHDPAKWPEFQRRYQEELKSKKELLKKIKEESGKGPVTLLFGTRETEHNNAVALRALLEKI